MTLHDLHQAAAGEPDWLTAVRQLLAAMPGNNSLLLPVRGEAGEVVDFSFAAVSPGAIDAFGRQSRQMLGLRLWAAYPDLPDEVWQRYFQVLSDGVPQRFPLHYHHPGSEQPAAQFTVSAYQLGLGLFVSWVREDDYGRLEERTAQTERLANLGWVEQDLMTGTTNWSDQLYRIFERDPATGPLSPSEWEAVTVPSDRPVQRRAIELMGLGRPVDVTYRISCNGRVKYLRAIADTVRDIHGQPLRSYGIIQDITARQTSQSKLAEVEQQLYEHQQRLAAENRLVAELQRIILPFPPGPVDLPGLRIAVRYLPAEQTNRIGGDWYHAEAAHDGSVILAVGDMAGHGLRVAAGMAQVRQALATLITTATTDPAELLSYLNRLVIADGELSMVASAIVGRYQPATGELTWAQAGHPAPLRTRGGATTELARPVGLLLGADDGATYGTQRIRLLPDDLLVFYTDGLIERRGQSLADGLKKLVASLDRLSAERSPRPLADLLEQLPQASPDDDTCILAVRRLAGSDARLQQVAEWNELVHINGDVQT